VLGDKSEKAENLFYLAMDLDPEPGRLRLRKAIFDSDLATLLDLALPQNLAKLAPGSIWVLSATLWDRFEAHRPDVYRMYDEAQHLYPGDYVLQVVGGEIYQLAGQNQAALVCRTAALSLRPEDPRAQLAVEDTLFYLGRLTEAENATRAYLAKDPSNADAHYILARVLQQLGDYAGALASMTRSIELVDDPTRHPDLLALRFRQGLATKDEIARALSHEVVAQAFATYMCALLDHPDPAQRDPMLVLRTLTENSLPLTDVEWRWAIEAVAKARSEDWPGALAAIEGHFSPTALLILTPGAYDFLRALIYSHVGREDAARECYARGMATWNGLIGSNPAAWERSDVMRWRREAEAALSKK
jgi:tetratricopeptide (TPR) repeat protein